MNCWYVFLSRASALKTAALPPARLLACALAATAAAAAQSAQVNQATPVNVVRQHNDNARTGANLAETTLTPSNVNSARFGMLFKHVVDDQVYTQPLLLTDVHIGGGWHDLVYVTTVNNSVYAFDANDPSAKNPYWHVNFGTPISLRDVDYGCLDMNGNMGIIGTPVIDPDKGILYVVSITKVAGTYVERLHALDVSTGADLPQSPSTITAPDFNPVWQNQRPALMLDHGNVYIGYASHCDKGHYHGFLLSYNATTLQQVGVLNTSPGGEGASIWQSGQAPAIDDKGNIYLVTGNGSWNGSTQFSESFLKLTPEMKLVDWFTPSNHVQLDKEDADLDSSGATLIPGTHLVLGGGKQGVLYSIDTEKLGHLGDEHAAQHFPISGSHIHNLVYWQSDQHGRLLYLWGQRDRARVYHFTGDALDQTPLMTRDEKNEGHPGAMMALSANGGKDGILWASIHAIGDSWHASMPGILHAYDADDIRHELWNSLQVPARDDCNEYSKMAPPTVANGKVYLASFGTENTGTGQLCTYGLLPVPSAAAPAAPANIHATVDNKTVTITWDPVPGARIYTLESTQGSTPVGTYHVAASGLTRRTFAEPAAEKGSTSYRVTAVTTDGTSAPSTTATVTIEQVPIPHPMVMH